MAEQTTTETKTEEYRLPPEFIPDVRHLITEDDTPVDNLISEKQMRLLTEPLYASWQTDQKFLAAANVGLFFSIKESAIVPDVMISLGVEPHQDWQEKEHRSYFIWEFGKPPEVAVEIVSNLKGEELGEKMAKYAQTHIFYYIVFDPMRCYGEPAVRIFRHNGWELEPMDTDCLAKVGLCARLWEGEYEGKHYEWLRWFTPDGTMIPTGRERAEQERERAERAEERIRLLEEKLRLLGIQPDEV